MEPEGSLPHSQKPASCPCPEPDQSSPCPAPHYLKNNFNIIIPATSRSSKWFLPTKTLYTPLLSPISATCPTHLILLDLITQIISSSSSLCSFLHSPVTSSLLDSNISLSTLFSNTIILRCSLSVRDHVSYPYETTDKIIILFILVLIFFISILKFDNLMR